LDKASVFDFLKSMSQTENLKAIADRRGVSLEAARHLYEALRASHGGMAQFSHPELGGHGQWMRGGMTMIGDMFNNALKAKVDAHCAELAGLAASEPARAETAGASFFSTKNWWPSELGRPSSTGGQNQLSYAYFPQKDRVAVRDGDAISLFDTTGHEVSGFSQQQQNDIQGLHLSSNRGLTPVLSLPRVER
jgi:hypothetical protein